uniref:transglutaminase N-terminal domain-containing protein n=1 Tax=Roseateles sp. TaxID=1971397 RepID=UPI00286C365F
MSSAATPVRAHWRYRVEHETEYRYQSQVTLSQQYLHLTPRSFALQATESHSVLVRP